MSEWNERTSERVNGWMDGVDGWCACEKKHTHTTTQAMESSKWARDERRAPKLMLANV